MVKKNCDEIFLPHELLIQIIMKLPVKSLIRFKCVCKFWFSLISDPNFANSHFHLTAPTHTPRFLCLSALSPEIRSFDFVAFINNDLDSSNFTCLTRRSYFPFEIKGSCRGFIFLYRHPNIYIWNPATRVEKQICMSPFNSKAYIRLYGFGYDRSRDDYVVILLSIICNQFLVGVVPSHLEFFSFRDNTWKEIEIEIEGAHYDGRDGREEGVLFNEAIHWLALRRDLGLDVIVAFDLIDRKLFEMRLPIDFNEREIVHSGLWVFGEFLSLWAKDDGNDKVEIWVMKEYKVHSSWTKTLVLPLDAIPDRYFHPIYSTKNGDIIGKNCGTRLVKYNDKGQLLVHRSFCNSPSEVVMYTESLLSLVGDDEHV